MLYTKLYLLFTICVTVIAAHLDFESTLPYFPIEISRVAASSKRTLNLFRMLALTVGPVMLLLGEMKDMASCVVWLGLITLAWFDDVNHLLLHMLGVGILVIGSMLSHKFNAGTILSALLIYGIRLVIKATVLVTSGAVPITPRIVLDLTSKAFDAMFNGSANFTNEQWIEIKPVYMTSGILQWVVFFLLSFMF